MEELLGPAILMGVVILILAGTIAGVGEGRRVRAMIVADAHSSVGLQFAAKLKHAPTATAVRSITAKWKTEAELYAEPARTKHLQAADEAAARWFLAEADRLEKAGDAWKAMEALQAAQRYTDTKAIRQRIDGLVSHGEGF